MNCELCKLARGNVITRKYGETDAVIVVDCETCHVPLVVWKLHTAELSASQLVTFKVHARKILGNDYVFKHGPRRIKDHYHEHYKRRE